MLLPSVHEFQFNERMSLGIRGTHIFDKQCNAINDPDLIAEIKRGANVISYREELPK